MPRLFAVNRFYWPDESATSQLLNDLLSLLAVDGWAVHTVAANRTRDGQRLPRREARDGVIIHRAWATRFGQHSILLRLLDYFTFCVSATLVLMFLTRRGDTLLVKTDPPLMSVPMALVARLRQVRLVIWQQDLFPEIAEAVGVLPRRTLIGGAARLLRNWAARHAETNVVISDSMAELLRAEGLRPQDIVTIPNWCDERLRPVSPEENPLRRRWGLGGKVVIGYSGTLGRAHLGGRIAELVQRTADIPDLVWVFIGGGVGMRAIEALEDERNRGKLIVLPAQSREDLSYSLSVPDIHLISLASDCEGLMMPSKFYGVLAVGRPILNLGAAEGVVARETGRHGIGVTISPDEPERWRAVVEKLVRDGSARAEMSHRAVAAHRKHYNSHTRLRQWRAVVDGKSCARAGLGSVSGSSTSLG